MNDNEIKIAIDCDNTAIELKIILLEHIQKKGIDIVDLNYLGKKNANYPEIGYELALKIQSEEYNRGILICGTGIGMAIIANKVKGVYASVCHDVYSAERLRKSNNAQIITMGARVIGPEAAKTIVDAWLKSEFERGSSVTKIEQIQILERKSFSMKA